MNSNFLGKTLQRLMRGLRKARRGIARDACGDELERVLQLRDRLAPLARLDERAATAAGDRFAAIELGADAERFRRADQAEDGEPGRRRAAPEAAARPLGGQRTS